MIMILNLTSILPQILPHPTPILPPVNTIIPKKYTTFTKNEATF